MPTTKKESEEPEDPWSSFTPESLIDGVAEKLWAKMGEKADGEEEPEAEPEAAPAQPIGKGKKFAAWFTGQGS